MEDMVGTDLTQQLVGDKGLPKRARKASRR